jgi:hypothetical protein
LGIHQSVAILITKSSGIPLFQGKPEEPSTSGAAGEPQSRGKKRVAYETATKEAAAAKRPLHMKKPALKTPAQAMLDRYHKIQVEWAGLYPVKQLYYLLIFSASHRKNTVSP